MFMPLMFTGMLLWAPSGLVLYWTVSNLWTIGQQVITNRLIGPAPQHVVAAARGTAAQERGLGTIAASGGEGAEVMEQDGAVVEVQEFVDQHAQGDGTPARDFRARHARQRPLRSVGRRRRSAPPPPRRNARRAAAHRQHGVPPPARRRSHVRARLPRLPQRQGCRAAADGALHDGEGEVDRARRRRSVRSIPTRAASCTSPSPRTRR